MPFAGNKTVPDHVLVFRSTSETLMKLAGQNAPLTQIVHPTKCASTISALILVPEPAGQMPNAKLLLIRHRVRACTDIQEIHSVIVLQFLFKLVSIFKLPSYLAVPFIVVIHVFEYQSRYQNSNQVGWVAQIDQRKLSKKIIYVNVIYLQTPRHCLSTYADRHLADRTVNVARWISKLCALVCQHTKEVRQIADQNALSVPSVRPTRLVWIRNVSILAQALVDLMRTAKRYITVRFVRVNKDLLGIRSLDAILCLVSSPSLVPLLSKIVLKKIGSLLKIKMLQKLKKIKKKILLLSAIMLRKTRGGDPFEHCL